MSIIAWCDNFSVNIKDIDDQHKCLIDLINQLHDAMQEGQGRGILERVLVELIWYVQIHFSTEEKYMQNNDYPGYLDHKFEHDNLIEKVTELKKQYENGNRGLTIEVSMFLNNWLQKHILGSDKAFAPYLNSKGIE